MHLLQAGAAKSGNLWLYKIIEQIFDRAGISQKSFVQNQPIYDIARDWPLSYPEQVDIDMLDIREQKCYWRISTIFQMPIEDLSEYISRSSHVWTHSRICDRSLSAYPKFDKVVYIVRDPRDRAISEAKFAFSDYMQRFDPPKEPSFEAYIESNLEAMMNRWRWHVYDHIRYAEDLNVHVVFYERLLEQFEEELERLLDYLEIELTQQEKDAIAGAVSFSSMKKESPKHLRKGKSGDWETHFSPDQKKRAHDIIEPLISYTHYDQALPEIPGYVNKRFLEEKLDEIGSVFY